MPPIVWREGAELEYLSDEFVDRPHPSIAPQVAEAFARFARIYPQLCKELFDDDPDLSSR